jgi:hypothetical protein
MPDTRSVRRWTSLRSLARFMPLAAAAVAISACLGGQSQADTRAFWNPLTISGNEVEGYESLADMAVAADAVVAGRISSVGQGRVFQGDVPEDRAYYVRLNLGVTQVARGSVAAADIVGIELLLPQVLTDADFVKAVEQLEGQLPESSVVVFLRQKDDSDEQVYRPVNSFGLFVAADGGLLMPIGDTESDSSPFEAELATFNSVDELVAFVSGLP